MRAEAQAHVDSINEALALLRRFLDWDRALRRLDELNARVEDQALWNNPKEAQAVMRERRRLDEAITATRDIERELSDTAELIEMAEAEGDAEMADEGVAALKALADRLAEAFAEALHAHVRTTLWGYAPDEQLTNEALIREQYRGIRPAPGYPACPEHSLKGRLFEMLGAQRNAGLELTESFAMLPTAAVSGFYFGHAQAEYFGVARIGEDQLADYAQRLGVDRERATRLLRPNLD